MSATAAKNRLYLGDCLDVLREDVADNTVDLIYLDPPFNSKRLYNAFIGGAQWVAFNDTWCWHEAVDDFHEVAARVDIAPAMEGLRRILGEGSELAYLAYMANRLAECRRVLKPTGSIWLHCDPTMSHYLKAVMDVLWGRKMFKNEIVWKRFNFHADAKRFGAITDRILFYSGGDAFNPVRVPYSDSYIKAKFTHRDEDGRQYRLADLNPPGGRGPVYEFHNVTKPWRMTKDRLEQLDAEAAFTPKAGFRNSSGISMKCPDKRSPTYGRISHRSTLAPRSAWATQRRSPWRCWSASSGRPRTKVTSYLTRSAGAGPPSTPPRRCGESGSASTCA